MKACLWTKEGARSAPGSVCMCAGVGEGGILGSWEGLACFSAEPRSDQREKGQRGAEE